jgi:hypothetical protein
MGKMYLILPKEYMDAVFYRVVTGWSVVFPGKYIVDVFSTEMASLCRQLQRHALGSVLFEFFKVFLLKVFRLKFKKKNSKNSNSNS